MVKDDKTGNTISNPKPKQKKYQLFYYFCEDWDPEETQVTVKLEGKKDII